MAHRSRRDEAVAVEEPLEIRYQGQPLITVMRSPGDDAELCRGILYTEGFVTSPEAIRSIQPVPQETLTREEVGNVFEVDLAEPPQVASRAAAVATSCGVCGKRAISELEIRAKPVRSGWTISPEVLVTLPERMTAEQSAFRETGAVHAAGLFDANGSLWVAREDVGRHNAVDKVLGWAMNQGRLPLSETALCVSGRVGFEIVQKAVLGGIPVIAAVSAPTSLAIDVAERFRVTLCGFVRGGTFNVYSHGARVA